MWVNEGFAGTPEEEEWLRQPARPGIEQTVQAIGAERVLFGNDDRQADALHAMRRAQLSGSARAAVMGGNAARLLGLEQ